MKNLLKFKDHSLKESELRNIKGGVPGFPLSQGTLCAINDAILQTSLDIEVLNSAMNYYRSFCQA